jgi:SHS2 domain-containing protein
MSTPEAPAVDYFEHDADIGIIGRGASPEEAFERAAEAMFAVMLTLDAIAPERSVDVAFEEDDLELALVQWLNALLAAARTEELALARFRLQREGSAWTGQAGGEPLRPEIERGTEVKGATLTALRVEQTDGGGWEARCVVDV